MVELLIRRESTGIRFAEQVESPCEGAFRKEATDAWYIRFWSLEHLLRWVDEIGHPVLLSEVGLVIRDKRAPDELYEARFESLRKELHWLSERWMSNDDLTGVVRWPKIT